MTLDEFKQVYDEYGEVVAKLRIHELDANVNDLVQHFPQALNLLGIDPYSWANLLVANPQISQYCNFAQFNGNCWAWLLAGQPKFAQHCVWESLDSSDWYFLLVSQPEFLTQFNNLPAEQREQLTAKTKLLTDLTIELQTTKTQ